MLNLIVLFFVPFATSFAAFFFLPLAKRPLKAAAFMMSLLPLIILLSGEKSWIGSEINYDWLPGISIKFHLMIDYLSLIFLYLLAIVIPVSILAVRSAEIPYPNFFYGMVLLLQGLLIGFFTARDLAVFTIFWEGMLVPLYFIISLWGGPNRQQAAIKFLVYMIAGSTLMIAAVLALYFSAESLHGTGTFNIDVLAKIAEKAPYAPWLCAIFLLAFAVKTPLFPFHAWLPDTYYQASTAGTILLSGILSKAGIYGFMRIGLEFYPTLMIEWSPLLLGLGITGVLYGGLAAWMQNDFKRLLAYSSFAHVNFVLVGIFVWNQVAHSGAILQAFNHGITISALFMVAGWLEERLGSTSIHQASGLAKFMPLLCWLTLFFVLSNVALPGFNNFIGELMILFGLFSLHPWLAGILGLTVILSVIYMLRWMQKIYFQSPGFFQDSWIDIKGRELAISLPLIIIVMWIGVYPAPILKQIEPAVKKIASTESPKEAQ